LSTKLTQLERFQAALRVVPFSEVRSAGIQSVGAARESFGVTLVVTGSVQRVGEAIRLTANLVDAESLRQLRAVVLDAERGDPVALQDGLIRQVADMLDLEISSEAGVVLAAGGTGVGSAWEQYVEGRGHLQRYDDPASVDAAISAFQAALQRDPEYALAYAGLGEAYWREYELTRDDRSVELGQRACERALALNDLLAPVHVTLGLLHSGTGELEAARVDFEKALALDPLNADALQGKARVLELSGEPDQAKRTYLRALELRPDYWGFHNALAVFYWRQARYADAEQEFRRVIELAPGSMRGYSNLGGLLFLVGREDEAVAVLERSLAIRPTYVALSNLGTIQFFRGRYEEAAEAFRRALKQDDRDLDLWRNLGASLYWTPGRRGEARPAFERARELAEAALRVNPRDTAVLTVLADALAMLGEGRAARDRLGEALKLAPEDVNVQFRAAQIYTTLGERSAALKWLIKALEGGYSLRELLSVPDLAELRQDPRFKEALKARTDSDVIPE
jgi:tetratricopeptide (TPR) repeat protein